MDESKLWVQSLKVEAQCFWAFEQLVHLWPNFTDLICSVHQYPSRQKVASIWAYMCFILRVHSNHSLCLFIPNLLTLHVQYTKILAVKKWLPFELICAVYSEYIVTIHCVRPYPILLTLYVQYTKAQAVKKWFPFELICALYLEYIVTVHFVRPCPFWVLTYIGAFQVMHPYGDSVCLA